MFEIQITSANIQYMIGEIHTVMVHFELSHKEDKGRSGVINGYVALTGEEYEANQDSDKLAVVVKGKLAEMLNQTL